MPRHTKVDDVKFRRRLITHSWSTAELNFGIFSAINKDRIYTQTDIQMTKMKANSLPGIVTNYEREILKPARLTST